MLSFFSTCLVIAISASGAVALAGEPTPSSVGSDPPSLSQLIATHGPQLGAVAGDAEAMAYLGAHLGPALRLHETVVDLQPPMKSSRPSSDPIKGLRADLVESAIRLVAALSAWHWSEQLLQAVQGEEKDGARQWLNQSSAARAWLSTTLKPGPLPSAAAFADALLKLLDAYPPQAAGGTAPPCTDYAMHLDRTYPRLTGDAPSWLAVVEQDGLTGLKTRLDDSSLASGLSLVNQRACARAYLDTRLFPVFRAHLVAQALSARAAAEREAYSLATLLQRWPERKRETLGLARLCGTWQWSVHNHRHHQESKTTMTFPAPDAPAPAGLRPSKIVVMGDVVYLRWDFQGGFQEESLLFAGEGTRLEGTFINSTGAWGSVTGKRMTACPR